MADAPRNDHTKPLQLREPSWEERLESILKNKRVAIIHDQLYTIGGAEKVLKEIIDLVPHGDVHALFDLLDEAERRYLTGGRPVATSMMQRLPLVRKLRKLYFPIMPFAIEQMDLGDYDVLISSSYLVAKGVIAAPNQLHVCYMHSPMRYVWDQQTTYVGQFPSRFGVRRMIVRILLHYVRGWDSRSTNGVDLLLTNSEFVARRAMKAYRRTARVLYPPVELDRFLGTALKPVDARLFVTMSRLAEGKRVHLLLEAFRALPECRLLVAGDGPMRAGLEAAAPANVSFLGRVPDEAIADLFVGASAFVYAAEEDFGIAPVEAQACGLPVIAPNRGGTAETVRDFRVDPVAPTGVLFDRPTPEAVVEAIRLLTDNRAAFRPENARANVRQYDRMKFREGFAEAIVDIMEAHSPLHRRGGPVRAAPPPATLADAGR